MKFCETHWNRLREVINQKGMGHLVSKSTEELNDRMLKQNKNNLTFIDPLITSMLTINKAALDQGGLYLMSTKPDGTHYCPLCEGEKQLEGLAEDWIDGVTDEVKALLIQKNQLNEN